MTINEVSYLTISLILFLFGIYCLVCKLRKEKKEMRDDAKAEFQEYDKK